jgi:hypothetical protein
VSDLARKHHLLLSRKAMMYHWNLLTIAIFYGLPVIQLVVTYQQVYPHTHYLFLGVLCILYWIGSGVTTLLLYTGGAPELATTS